MDKFMNSPWFFRIVAFALAGLLFTSINLEPDASKRPLGLNTPGQYDTETIVNVPVEIDYDHENLVVTGAPRTVDVTLKGAKSLLISAKNQREFRVYIDLSDPEISMGRKKAPLKIRDLNEKLSAKISPKYATVTVQERVTKEFPVDPDFNRSSLEEGYTAERPEVNPGTVKITGAKDIIERISYVKANIELNKGVNDDIHRQARVQALDRDLNKLNVQIEPSSVDVSVHISIPSKTVPIVPVQTGTPDKGVAIKDISVEPKKITLYGKESVLGSINEVRLPVSVNNVKGNTELELPITMPENLRKMSMETAKVKITTEKAKSADTGTKNQQDKQVLTQSKKINNLAIQPVGIADDMQVEFISPAKGQTSISLTGDPDELKKSTASNIKLSVNVSNLEEGEHDVAILVSTSNKVKWELSEKKATVSITKKNKQT
jgi:YbbR domain-containing protein